MSDTIRFTTVDDEGYEVEHALPAKYEVCPTCEGRGKHVNRAIDGDGITADEMAELGDEFLEDYRSGVYDVPCEECHGLRMVQVVDAEWADPALLKLYEDQQYEEYEWRRQIEMERRLGL